MGQGPKVVDTLKYDKIKSNIIFAFSILERL